MTAVALITEILTPANRTITVRNIYCVARNYPDHARELDNELPSEPVFFQKSSAALSNSDSVQLPPDGEIHNELEIVILVDRDGFRIEVENAWQHIGGITLGVDFTDRSMQNILKAKRLPWFAAKTFSNSAYFCDFRPVDRVKWQQDFWLQRNGREVQRGSSTEMHFEISQLVNNLSKRVSLMAGDLLFTGTPAGVGPVEDGDILTFGLGDEVFRTLTIKR